MQPIRRYGFCTITSGQSLSDAYDLGEKDTIVGIILPTLTAASITLAGGLVDGNTQPLSYGGPGGANEYRDSLTYVPVFDQTTGAEWSIASSTGGIYVAIDQTKLAGLGFIKVRSGTSAAPVVQGSDRVITIVTVAS